MVGWKGLSRFWGLMSVIAFPGASCLRGNKMFKVLSLWACSWALLDPVICFFGDKLQCCRYGNSLRRYSTTIGPGSDDGLQDEAMLELQLMGSTLKSIFVDGLDSEKAVSKAMRR